MEILILDFRVLIRGLAVSLLCLVMLGGCARNKAPRLKQGYFGPTLTLPEVVSKINANNSRIPTLWARFSYEATLIDAETKKETFLFEENSSTLQYRAPGEFRLRASKTGAGVVLDLGINSERFWLITPEPGPDTMWWGYLKPNAPLNKEIPISPQGMLEVLGLSTLNVDLLAEPAPVLRFNNDYRVYMLIWVKQSGDRFVVTREVWYDMNELLPVKVLLFDENGRPILRADLKGHKGISGDAAAPKVATVYDLFFPETRSKMLMNLTRTELQHDGAPNDNSFRFVKTIPVKREIRVDEKP